MRDRLDGRVAVVTGAGRGIGRSVAEALAGAGCTVVLAARSQNELNEAADGIRSAGGTALVAPTDVSKPEECEALIARAADAFGRIDILVNNAGAARFRPLWEVTSEEFDFHYQLLLRSVHLCSAAAVRAMMPRKSGIIVNIASSSGKKPYPAQGAYCAMKAAVIMLTRVMAMELREHGIRAHAICPGAVDTAMADAIHPERDREGWLQPEDVAEAVLYACTMPAHMTVDEIALRRYKADPF